MKILVEIDIPEIECIDAPIKWNTPIGEMDCKNEIRSITDTLKILMTPSKERHYMLNTSSDIRTGIIFSVLCKKSWLLENSYEKMYSIASKLSVFLGNYSDRVGCDPDEDFDFTVTESHNGKVWRTKGYPLEYIDKDSIIRAHIYSRISSKKYIYEILG